MTDQHNSTDNKYSNPESIHNKIDLLLSKYGDTTLNEPQNICVETQHLRKILKSQYEIIQAYELKYQDLTIEYNNKIEKLKDEHQQNIAELHKQFRAKYASKFSKT